MPCWRLTHYHRGRRGQSQIESGEESSEACYSKLCQDSDGSRSCSCRIPCFWIASEYVFNAYFHDNVDQLLGTHGTTFTAALGLGIGLAGSAIAATLYRNLQHAKSRLETIATPKIRGAVEKILSSLPAVEESQRASVARVTAPSAMTLSSS